LTQLVALMMFPTGLRASVTLKPTVEQLI
jgi:hypothetical protein